MKRAFRFLVTLGLVLSTGSAFTLACAFACSSPPAAAPEVRSSHCHQPVADLPGPGFQKPARACPVLASLEDRDAGLHAPSFIPSFDLGLAPLPREAVVPGRAPLLALLPEVHPPPSASPRAERPHVLRI